MGNACICQGCQIKKNIFWEEEQMMTSSEDLVQLINSWHFFVYILCTLWNILPTFGDVISVQLKIDNCF